jgi:hypothetical protein
MEIARTFFYVCGSLFLLALAYHLGVRSATAQSSPTMEGASFTPAQPGSYLTASFAVNRVLYASAFTGSYWSPMPAQPGTVGPVPGTSPIVATAAFGGASGALVLLANGDVYRAGNGSWEYGGNLVGMPVSSQRSSLGQLKARYR